MFLEMAKDHGARGLRKSHSQVFRQDRAFPPLQAVRRRPEENSADKQVVLQYVWVEQRHQRPT